jgi:hypothetical protein
MGGHVRVREVPPLEPLTSRDNLQMSRGRLSPGLVTVLDWYRWLLV